VPFSKHVILFPFDLACLTLAGMMRIVFQIIHLTCRIKIIGVPTDNLPHIHAFWHQNLPLYFISYTKRPKHKVVWMQHPKWYMKPIHFLNWWYGIEVVYGSSGNSGRKALEKIVYNLKDGYSTSLNPDGPKGPPKLVKNGIVLMSMESGAPIQPIKFRCSHFVKLPSWDEKIIPLPFSRINVEYGYALHPRDHDFSTLKLALEDQMK
jgi:hypothetical protein